MCVFVVVCVWCCSGLMMGVARMCYVFVVVCACFVVMYG